jgi:hypothetical protein
MIDTVRFKTSVAVDQKSVERLINGEIPEWKFLFMEVNTNGRSVIDPRRHGFTHSPTALRIRTDSLFVQWIEVSMPRLLGGSNGTLIRTPADLREAVKNLLHLVRLICPRIEEHHLEVTRLDLTLNLQLDPRAILPLHRHARHPRIHRETEEYYNDGPPHDRGSAPYLLNQLNTVRLNGVFTCISFYDKVSEQAAKRHQHPPGSSRSTRVEIQLRGRQRIAKLFGLDEKDPLTLDRVDFSQCYRRYREIMLEFDPVGDVPEFKANIPHLLAVLELHPSTWSSLGGMEPLEWYRMANQVNDRQFRKMRRDVRDAKLSLVQFRWADHLPSDRLPDVVDIDHDGIETLVPSPCTILPEPFAW